MVAHAHQICSFSLRLRDAFSNHRDSGGDNVRADFQGPLAVKDRAGDGPIGSNLPVTVSVTIKDLQDGSYSITYHITVGGRYSLAAKLSDVLTTSQPLSEFTHSQASTCFVLVSCSLEKR